MYEYRAKLVDVVDGDTIDVEVDLGFNIKRRIRLRLKDVDTHEKYGVAETSEEYQRAIREEDFVEAWLSDAKFMSEEEYPLIVRTEKKGKFGRYLADVRRSDGEVLNDVLLSQFDDITYE